jgi:hypothetical protein
MNTENAKAVTLKQKATHELVQLVAIFLYLAFSFAPSRPTACFC